MQPIYFPDDIYNKTKHTERLCRERHKNEYKCVAYSRVHKPIMSLFYEWSYVVIIIFDFTHIITIKISVVLCTQTHAHILYICVCIYSSFVYMKR